jgi:K+-sensing histidine kinase KdpD
MEEDLKSVIQTFRQLVAAYQLAADRLARELDQLKAPTRGLADPTERLGAGQFEAQLQASLEQSQLKSDFLATVVTEVQTSLAALKGALYILLHEEPTDPGNRETLVAVAHEHVGRLMDLLKFPVL